MEITKIEKQLSETLKIRVEIKWRYNPDFTYWSVWLFYPNRRIVNKIEITRCIFHSFSTWPGLTRWVKHKEILFRKFKQ